MAENGKREYKIPDDDNKPRSTCRDCGHIDYENPQNIVGLVAIFNDKVLLGTRKIAPRVGYWDLPEGHHEKGESLKEGALREAWEEALMGGSFDEVKRGVKVGPLLGIYDIPFANKVTHLFLAEIQDESLIKAGPEVGQAKLFAWNDIPWNKLAFPVVADALRHWQKVKGQKDFAPEYKVMPQINLNGP